MTFFFLFFNFIIMDKIDVSKATKKEKAQIISNLQWNQSYINGLVNPTDHMCMLAIRRNPDDIQYIDNQTERYCLKAVCKKGTSIQHVKNQTDNVCIAALKQTHKAYPYIRNKQKYAFLAVKINGHNIKHVPDQTTELCKLSLDTCGGVTIQHFRDQTTELCEISLRKSGGKSIQYIHDQTTKLCKMSIDLSVHNLQHIHDQTYELILYTFTKYTYGRSFVNKKYVTYDLCVNLINDLINSRYLDVLDLKIPDEIYEDVCLYLLSKKNNHLKYIPKSKRTFNMCCIPIQNGLDVLDNVPNHVDRYDELCKLAININGNAIRHVKNSNIYHELCILAVTNTCTAIQHISRQYGVINPEKYFDLCKIAADQVKFDEKQLDWVCCQIRDRDIRNAICEYGNNSNVKSAFV